ncbi:MAG: hypothetical protein FWG90_01095 [Oscillospiraceae bacterium]|nr:hypothetical protein [Oscillospiraceae bacterium]
MKIGNIIKFVGYDWKIIDVQDNKALIITEDLIEDRIYSNEYAAWVDCDLSNRQTPRRSPRFVVKHGIENESECML